jgi:hypothetical protein
MYNFLDDFRRTVAVCADLAHFFEEALLKRVVLSAFIFVAGSSVLMLAGCPQQGNGPGAQDFYAPPADLSGTAPTGGDAAVGGDGAITDDSDMAQ